LDADPPPLDGLNLEEWEQEIDDDQEALAAAALSVIVIGTMESHRRRVQQRHPSRLYLCRPQLLPNARINTPWQRLKNSRSDRAFITTMGFDVQTFEDILTAGFGRCWNETPIPREDTNNTGPPRPYRRSLDADDALGLVLHYLNSTMREISLQQIFAIIPSSLSRYITFGLDIFLQTLRSMPDARISWPGTRERFIHLSSLIQNRHSRLIGAFGSIDGLNLAAQTSDNIDIENATYNSWLSEHFISSVLVFSPEGAIIAANLNAPGSWHDSRVAHPIYEKLCTQTPDDFYLVADTAFPRGATHIAGRIRAPLKSGDRFQAYRQTAEWGNRTLQGSFGRLRIPLEMKHTERRGNLLETCVRAHNLRGKRVGFNQIRTVYMPQWQKTEEDVDVWNNFESMLFSKQRAWDRVSRFHMALQIGNEEA